MEQNKKIHIGVVASLFGNFDRGGAEVQVDSTVNALNKIDGISAEIITSQTKELERFDIVHFFKSSMEYFFCAKFLKDKKIPYVVSTIIYPESESREVFKYNFLRSMPILNRISATKFQYFVWQNASMLFPNTDQELLFLRKIGVKAPAAIIPNGLDMTEMGCGDEAAFLEQYPYLKNQSFVLNVARIDRRKNQKNLVLACKDLDLPVVLIGNNLDNDSFRELEAINYSKMYYLGPIFDKKILFGAYKACALFCLPSIMETPGIAAMEAAYFDKPIVITKFGGTQYYFKDKAYYVDWHSVDEIKKGIAQMLQQTNPETHELMKQYSWDRIAEMYVREYSKILKPRS